MSTAPNTTDVSREAILEMLGLFYVPDNVTLLHKTGSQTFINELGEIASADAYYMMKHDEHGNVVKISHVPSLETAERTKEDILKAVRRRMIVNYGAIPRQDGLVSDLRPRTPSEEFLSKAGVQIPLPTHMETSIERRGDMPYLIVKLKDEDKEVVVELRETGYRTPDVVLSDVKKIMTHLGAPALTP